MTTLIPVSLLVVDSDHEFARLLATEAEARGYRAVHVTSVDEALTAMARDAFDAALVDLSPGAETAFDLLADLKRAEEDTEVIVMSDRTALAANLHWFDPAAFSFVRKSDMGQVFAALARALERRRMTTQNRRLVWELQTINDIAGGFAHSLELEDVLAGALQRLVAAMEAACGSIRLRDAATGAYESGASVGAPVHRQLAALRLPALQAPSDRVIATRAAVVVEDFVDLLPAAYDGPAVPFRSAISVPMFAGEDLLGTLELASRRPRRFQLVDQRLVATIAGQIVVAIQNAQLHRSVRSAKRELERTFDAFSDPIAVFNSRAELVRGNRALAAHLAMPVTALPHLTCAEVGFCGGRTCPMCSVGRALGQQDSAAEVTLPDGQIFSVTTFPVDPAGPGGGCVVQVAKNVTQEIRSARRLQQMSNELGGANGRLVAALDQLKSTQAQLVQAEKLSAIGQLVAGVAHELNNPLTSVIGYAQLVEEELREMPGARPPEEVAQDLRRIAEESERAARIVRNLLAFARRQSVSRMPHAVEAICARVLALREYEFRLSGIELHTDFPDDLPHILADEGQLQQVVLNLLLNAEQAMRGRDERRLWLSARLLRDSGAIELSIRDSGQGIDAVNLPRIFDPFFTTRDVGEGTGLGLSICYGIVRDHGGHIYIESRPQAGTTVRVLLPAPIGELADGAEVLVAHADQSEREFICAALSGWGCRPVSAGTLSEALALYARPQLQLVLLDRSIAAVDLAAWQRVRKAGRHVPLVVTSVAPDDNALERFSREEAVAALVPPLELRALHAAVRAGAKECV